MDNFKLVFYRIPRCHVSWGTTNNMNTNAQIILRGFLRVLLGVPSPQNVVDHDIRRHDEKIRYLESLLI